MFWEELIADRGRLELVVGDIISTVRQGRFPLVISDRKEHLSRINEEIEAQDPSLGIFRLEGTMSRKARREAMEAVNDAIAAGTPSCILSTSSLIGEGVDIPRLDTLILAMPVSFRGRMVQYAGRLNREHAGKNDVMIYDYLDTCSGLTLSMYRKRVAAYKTMGYIIQNPSEKQTTLGG